MRRHKRREESMQEHDERETIKNVIVEKRVRRHTGRSGGRSVRNMTKRRRNKTEKHAGT